MNLSSFPLLLFFLFIFLTAFSKCLQSIILNCLWSNDMTKYSKEALDEALLQAQSSDISMKTKGIKFLRQASCLETGTKNTYPIRDWFSETTNYTKLFKIVKSEKDPKLLWEYLFLIKTYCERYIDLAYLVKDSQNFIAKKENTEFKIKARELGGLFFSASRCLCTASCSNPALVFKENFRSLACNHRAYAEKT